MVSKSLGRVIGALARDGLDLSYDGLVYRLKRRDDDHAPAAELLLPRSFPLERKALDQLAAFAAVRHPNAGGACAVCATPDFHPGSEVPVGAVIATTPDVVIPQAIGTDINCGMRLHVVDLTVEEFLGRKAELIRALKGDLLLGTRDLPMSAHAMRAIFEGGTWAWLDALGPDMLGQLARSDGDQLRAELERTYELGSEGGSARWAPPDLLSPGRDLIRDGGLATVGGGNHFVELQRVDAILDGRLAWEWGVRPGQLAYMIHSGSRAVGIHVGRRWRELAQAKWPAGTKHPDPRIYPLQGADADEYLQAMSTAANYGYVNRLLLAELVRLRMRETYGADLEAPLVFDMPHNIVANEGGRNVHRKGATPAHAGQPVLIPGSMGQPSYLMVGLGNERFLASASHGAGRATARGDMLRQARRGADLGLAGVECITLREERLIEEAPAAYKDITPVIDIQVRAGIVRPVARLSPLLTFKA